MLHAEPTSALHNGMPSMLKASPMLMQSSSSLASAPSAGKRKKHRKSGINTPLADSPNGMLNSNGPVADGTATRGMSVPAPSLVALSANLVAVVGWEAASSAAADVSTASTSGGLRTVVVDTVYGTVQAAHRRAAACGHLTPPETT